MPRSVLIRTTALASLAFCVQVAGIGRVADNADSTVTITADASETPDLVDWAKAAESRCREWHPRIVRILGQTGEPVHREIKIVLKKDMPGIAATGGATINVSADYVRKHPDDDGMIVHELVHVVQAYPKYDPPWLVEGLADYVRYYHYEPGARRFPIVRGKTSYRGGYGAAARFLAWIAAAKDEQMIHKLDAALRSGEYRESFFADATGKSLDQLWSEFERTAGVDE